MRNVGEVLFLSKSDVDSVLTTKDCLERCIETFRWVGQDKVAKINPLHFQVSSPEGPYGVGLAGAYPSYIMPLKIAGIKWQGGYVRNRDRGLPYHTAIDIINDSETLMPLAIIDGTSITSMRTAGHAGVGAKYFAKKDSSVIAIIGCGLEGRTHLKVMNELFDIEEVRAFDIFKEMSDRFKKEMSEELKLNIATVNSAREAVKGADVICVVTTSREPVIKEEWVELGCHVCGTTGFTDLDPSCAMKFDKWVVGYYMRDLEWVEGSETGVRGGLKVGQFSRKNIYADLATEIISGKKPAREANHERTVMTHLGMPALDVAVAALVYEKAKEKGVGIVLKVF